ncbi:hypothetical protein LV82_01707 [Albidovulum inexpectatum]|uniref:Uncharacterized protein n=1 Tax=Albidovulum inexpectatum TaxID=196587 RepID=A0A2S5JHI7_9RHOB|nr:hypothetical protein [Albidovulum inexpectatum]PPB80974.1 hypothetical protein LV82_01707 [Albidovulum inexpectatum]
MTLKSEIEALQAEIRARASRARPPGVKAAPDHNTAPPDEAPHDAETIDGFLKLVGETLDEFGEEIDRYPRLAAMAALGVGLALGLLVGRATR